MSKAIDACWNAIGVRGDRSCARLAEHVHCRNCAVYAQAAHALLDVPVDEDYIAGWTARFAAEQGHEDSNDASGFVFRVGAEWLALPTAVLDSVVEWRPIHSLPHRREGIALGLVNVRGMLVICISLLRLLGAAAVNAPRDVKTQFQRMLVVQRGERRFALVVDEVHGVEHYASCALEALPATTAHAATIYTQAILPWRGKSLGLLDPEKLFAGLERSVA